MRNYVINCVTEWFVKIWITRTIDFTPKYVDYLDNPGIKKKIAYKK